MRQSRLAPGLQAVNPGPGVVPRRRPRLGHSGRMEISHEQNVPRVGPGAWVAPTAVLSGDVRVGPGSCVLHGAVLNADGGAVRIGANCVIMENAVLARHAAVTRSRSGITCWPGRTAT